MNGADVGVEVGVGGHEVRVDRRILPRALVTLILLRYKSVLRRMFWGSTKRRVFSIVGVGLMAMYILPSLLANTRPSPATPEMVRLWVPVFLVFIIALQLVVRARKDPARFQPAELDLIVPGPFSRRQLVTYQLAYQFGPLLLMGFWMAIFVRFGGSYLARALGVALIGQLVILLASIFASLAGIIKARVWWMGPLIALALAGIAYASVRMAPTAPVGSHNPAVWQDWLLALRHTPVVEGLCLPVRPYVETLMGEGVARTAMWFGIGVCMNLALAAVYIALDRGEVEALVTESQKRLARTDRQRRGMGGIANAERAAERRVPMPPRFAGIGPLAWRQVAMFYRLSGRIGVILTVFGTIALAFWISRIAPGEGIVPMMLIGWPASSVFLSMIIRCDFRSDFDHVAMLKTLPLRPLVVVCGQLAAPAGLFAIVQLLACVGLAIGHRVPSEDILGIALTVACIPLSVAMLAIENAVFLVSPTRSYKQAASAGFDPSLMGRQFLLTLLKGTILLLSAAVVGGPVAAILWLGGSKPVAVGVGIVIGLGIAGGLVMVCAKTFQAFDVAEDSPA